MTHATAQLPLPTMPRPARKVKHPARYSDVLLPILAELVGDASPILDPFAGTGRLAEIVRYGYRGTIHLNELEKEWAALCAARPGVVATCGDACDLDYPPAYFAAVVTSPTYANRLADHHKARDASRRRSYTHDLGRTLHPQNSGAMQWGEDYRHLHRRAWAEVARVLRPGGRLILNISDHIRNGERVPVTAWHVETLAALGFAEAARVDVPTPRLRYGANGGARVDCEHVIALVYTPDTAKQTKTTL